MICVECAAPVEFLYTYYSEDNIHATKCSHCGMFADKYIECDKTLTFIDVLLLRKSAIRHVVFNATAKNALEVFPHSLKLSRSTSPADVTQDSTREELGEFSFEEPHQAPNPGSVSEKQRYAPKLIAGVSPTVFRLVVFVTLFDIYLLWAMSERSGTPSILRFLVVTHPAVQYALFLTLRVCDTLIMHLIVRSMARYFLNWTDGGAISTSLLIGSFFKLLPILTLIWHHGIPFAERIVQYFSLYCVTEVLSITLGCNYLYAGSFTIVARMASILLYKLFWALV